MSSIHHEFLKTVVGSANFATTVRRSEVVELVEGIEACTLLLNLHLPQNLHLQHGFAK